MRRIACFGLLLSCVSVAADASSSSPPPDEANNTTTAMRYNVSFSPLDPNVTDPREFWLGLWNDVPESYCAEPRFPRVPTAGPIAMDVLHDYSPNGTVPKVNAKPTNTWQKNLWGFDWEQLPTGDHWGAVYPYPYIVSPKARSIALMYPGMPVHTTDNRAMIQQLVDSPPVPLKNPKIHNASYPYMTMAGSFDTAIQVRNGNRPIIRNLTELGAVIEYRDAAQNNKTVATVYLVKGSPFINVECDGADLAFGENGIAPPIISIGGLPPGQHLTNTHFKFWTAQGPAHEQAQYWHAFFSNPITLNYASPPNGPINATALYTGLLQFGVGEIHDVMGPLLNRSKGTYARGAAVEYDVGPTNGTVRFRYDVQGDGELMQLALPHHVPLLNSTNLTTEATKYWCVKGNMTAVWGDVWNMSYNLTSVGFGDAAPISDSMKKAVATAAEVDYHLRIDHCPGDNDTQGYAGAYTMDLYPYVRDLSGYVDVAITLEAVGQRSMAQKLTQKTVECLGYALRPTTEAPRACPLPVNNTPQCIRNMVEMYYDENWGGLVTGWFNRYAVGYCQCDLPGGPDACHGRNYCNNQEGWNGFANYGNAFYNDHHEQYGYIVRALAWALYFQETKGVDLGLNETEVANMTRQALAFSRDIANPTPEEDPYFPHMRHKDIYDGHSWAEGYDYSGRVVGWLNMQSGGEAINAYYAVYLLGLALNDTNVRDWGRVLAATEAVSIRQYQHLSNQTDDKTDQPTELFSEWGKCLPILFGNAASGATYYGPNSLFQCGITVLPFSPFTSEWLDPAWAQEAYDWMVWHSNRSGECVYFDPDTSHTNPCPGSMGKNWTGNEWGCCPTNAGFPDNQWRAWPDWYPTMYLFLAASNPMAAWDKLQYKNITEPTSDLPFPYLDSRGNVVGYHRTLSMTSAFFHVAAAAAAADEQSTQAPTTTPPPLAERLVDPAARSGHRH